MNAANVYGYSKLVFDNYVRRLMPEMKSTVVGCATSTLRPREQHRADGQVIHHFNAAAEGHGDDPDVRGLGGYGNGEQRRDFVFVKDLARINMFFARLLPEGPKKSVHGVVNAGTGEARTFKAVAESLMQVHGPGQIEYIRSRVI